MSERRSDGDAVAGTRCAECGTALEVCAVCDEEGCAAALCYRCVTIALGERAREPHEHGG